MINAGAGPESTGCMILPKVISPDAAGNKQQRVITNNVTATRYKDKLKLSRDE